jgi:hypothetical protein
MIIVDAANAVYDSRNDCDAVIETATNTLISACNATDVPVSVTSIGKTAFSGLDGFRTFSVPEGITEIGDSAFSGCTNLETIKLPDSLKMIGDYAFSFCPELKKIEIPANVETIHVSAFSNCRNLTELVVGDGLKEIQEIDRAWAFNVHIKTVYGSVSSIADNLARTLGADYAKI